MKETNLNKNSENTAKTIMKELPISTKHAIELCSLLRYKTVEEAKKILEGVIIDNKPIKYNRFTAGAGHKSNIGSGKIPIKASEHILKAIKSVESNALTKGLSKNLKITHLLANKASRPFHYGRQRRIKMKRTHIEVVVKEIKQINETQKKSDLKVNTEKNNLQSEIKQDQIKELNKTKKINKKQDLNEVKL